MRPPPRDGVAASRVGVGAGHFPTVLDFLVARFPAVGDWPARLMRGDVLDTSGQPLAGDAPCMPGQGFWYWRRPPPERRIPFEIELLFRDEHLVVVDKPHFLPVIPGGRHLLETVLVRLKQQLGIDTLAPMHRLDRDTAGVLVFTVQPATRHAYQSLLRDRRVHKVYEAIAPWRGGLAFPFVCRTRLEQQSGAAFMQMQVVPGEPNAETRIELIGRIEPSGATLGDRHRDPAALPPGPWAHYRLTPHTGRKHQLRAQMSALELPIVGDRIYPHLLPEIAPEAAPDYSQPLQLLAREFAFTDPISGEPRCFTSRRRLLACLPASGSADLRG
jgi:tRNA pseudouridine32 synthase/23S rRNA pseudouridine746 synthase